MNLAPVARFVLSVRGGDEIKPAFVELVIPAEAGNQHGGDALELDSRLRGNDGLNSSPSLSTLIRVGLRDDVARSACSKRSPQAMWLTFSVRIALLP